MLRNATTGAAMSNPYEVTAGVPDWRLRTELSLALEEIVKLNKETP